MKTTTHEFHNPDNLTPEQIGEGYRLLLNKEVKPRDWTQIDIERWNDSLKAWKNNDGEGFSGSNHYYTYRVPLSTWPLPEEAPTDNDRWESLLRTNSTLEKRVKELENNQFEYCETCGHPLSQCGHLTGSGEPELDCKVCQLRDTINQKDDQIVAATKGIHELQSKLTAAQARLEQLEWRPVSVKPTKKDADAEGFVQVAKRSGITAHYRWQADLQAYEILHWRPAALPAMPDQSRVEFEKWWNNRMPEPEITSQLDLMFEVWKAARAKEDAGQ